MPTHQNSNRFDDFYNERQYVLLKNSLYNYRLRSISVARYLRTQKPGPILEVGSGMSPVSSQPDRTVFSDLSFLAMQRLKQAQVAGDYVVADCMHLPFKAGIFTYTISSEVLEHIPDDKAALLEIARVTGPTGKLIVTFPHRRAYFSKDDLYVGHYRRYDVADMRQLLRAGGFQVGLVQKILGPLEKLTMLLAVVVYTQFHTENGGNRRGGSAVFAHWGTCLFRMANLLYMVPVWLEAKLLPLSCSTVLMIVGHRAGRQGNRDRL